MTDKDLSSNQAHALFDILSHAETYQEIRDFRDPESLDKYGPPFDAIAKTPSSFPALQALVSRFLLNLPGLRDLKAEFWKVQCATIIENLEKANLSESYDKGVLGSRKTVATAISALVEYPVRGTYGGFRSLKETGPPYDQTKAEDLSRAFRDFLNECTYGEILEDLVTKAAETDKLAEHDSLVQAAHEYVLVNLASFMHYALILSPKGQYMLKLIDNANKLVPYMVIRQTLKIGNVASMISAMMKVVLAKMSVSSVTNWIGLTASADEGMNLCQYIISTVLNWDVKELETRASKIDRERGKTGQEQLQALKAYVSKPREDQEAIRLHSEKNSISIVTAVLESTGQSPDMTADHHKAALEYLSIHLSTRDRREIIKVLCHSQPDHLTQSLRELVDAYTPVIRHVHNAVDLSDTVNDLEHFVRDMIKMAKIHTDKSGKSIVPSVGDFIQLLKKHQYASHKFIHQVCQNGKEVTAWYLKWAQQAASQFRRSAAAPGAQSHDLGAGDLTQALTEQFLRLPTEMRKIVIPMLDEQALYLEELHVSSLARLSKVINTPPSTHPHISRLFFPPHHLPGLSSKSNSKSSSRTASPDRSSSQSAMTGEVDELTSDKPPIITSDPGPGAYLARWQNLLDSTLITPATTQGSIRYGGNDEIVNQSATDVDGGQMVEMNRDRAGKNLQKALEGDRNETGNKTKKPDVRPVVDAMLPGFRKMLAQRSCHW